MKTIKLKRKLGAIIIALSLAISGMSLSASAATYSTYFTRGIKYLCWSKDSVTWKTNSKKITTYDANQSRSGILIELKGIKKEKARSSTTKYSL